MQRRTALKTLAAASLTSNLWAQRGLRINIGTVAPPNSAWHEILQQMQQDWTKISGGRVQMRVYPGGSLGDDAEMLRKVRVGQLQGVAMTGIGLALIDEGVDALHIPMLFDCYAELDAGQMSGTHALMDDFLEPGDGMTYFLDLPDGNPARCNEITAPPECTSEAIEDLP